MRRPDTIAEFFWESMPHWMQVEVDRLDDTYGMILPTGSRYYCPEHAGPDADWDVYFLSPNDSGPAMDLLDRRYTTNSGRRYQADDPGISLYTGKIDAVGKKQMLNVGIFFDPRQGQATKDATDFCLEMAGPIEKNKRKIVFKKFIDSAKGLLGEELYEYQKAVIRELDPYHLGFRPVETHRWLVPKSPSGTEFTWSPPIEMPLEQKIKLTPVYSAPSGDGYLYSKTMDAYVSAKDAK